MLICFLFQLFPCCCFHLLILLESLFAVFAVLLVTTFLLHLNLFRGNHLGRVRFTITRLPQFYMFLLIRGRSLFSITPLAVCLLNSYCLLLLLTFCLLFVYFLFTFCSLIVHFLFTFCLLLNALYRE